MTIREIAQRCGVSRGTVDRVINGRGKVNPDTETRVRRMLDDIGYTKNIAGRALTVRKQAPVIGVVLSSEGNPFFYEVFEGIRKAEAELADYGVTVSVESMRGYKTRTQLERIDALHGQISILVIQPINDSRILEKINSLAESGVATITVNSDLENSRRACYVGSDYAAGGKTAAGIIRLMSGGRARLGILTGVPSVLGHEQRLHGFMQCLAATCPDISILAAQSAHDDNERAYSETAAMLAAHPDLDTLMVLTAGTEGVCRAVIDSGCEGQISVFAFDNIPATRALMERGLIKAIVTQQPFQQGYQAIRAAYDIILTGKPASERLIMENRVQILENL